MRQKDFKWFVFGYGQWIFFRTKDEFRYYAKNNSTVYRIKDLRPMSELDSTFKIATYSDNKAFEIIDDVAVPFTI